MRPHAGPLVVAAAVAVAWLGPAAATAQQGTVYACIKRHGSINLVSDPADCASKKKALTIAWPSVDQMSALEARITALEATVARLQGQIAALQSAATSFQSAADFAAALQPYLRVETDPIDGLAGPHVIFEGANVHVRSGSGATDDGGTLTGLGNLVVGYDEAPRIPRLPSPNRSGSHNLIVGSGHEYTSSGGLVAGSENAVSGVGASVTGGIFNAASGDAASVSGGFNNEASDDDASVSGGASRTADSPDSWAAGSLFEPD